MLSASTLMLPWQYQPGATCNLQKLAGGLNVQVLVVPERLDLFDSQGRIWQFWEPHH